MTRDEIIAAIHVERNRQDKLHADWHGDGHGLAVLMEEVGEIAKAVYERDECMRVTSYSPAVLAHEREIESEIIQVAAVCVRWLENR